MTSVARATRSVLSRDELRARRLQLSRTWAAVVSAGSVPDPRLAEPRLLDSWRRSSEWVSPDLEAAPVDSSDAAIEAWRRTPIAAGLCAVEDEVRRAADDGDLVAAVTDESGRIVWTHGSRIMQRRSQRVGFVPGGRWDEASVGTNALALALRSGQSSTVYSAEHFSRAVHGWVCYAVPLTDRRTGQVRGVLDLSTTWDRAHPLAMTTAGVLGRMISAAAGADPDRGPTLQLSLLGARRARVGGQELVLPRRQLEILALLALHPDGLSLESLHARLYGDEPVRPATLKAEVSHLRTALAGSVGSRPYRLLVATDSDVHRVLRALDSGDVAGAVRAYGGPLLPGSESPDLAEWREYVEVALTTAVLTCRDVDVVLAHADRHPYDLQVQQHLVDVLPTGDPRLAGARARLHRALDV